MPVQACTIEGRPGLKWGEQGRCFEYEPGNKESRAAAEAHALAQGRAILASQARDDVEAVDWYRGHRLIRGRADMCVVGCASASWEPFDRLDAKRLPQQAYPRALENRYRRQLRARVRAMHELARAMLAEELKRIGPAIDERARRDGKPEDVRRLIRVIDRIERAVASSSPVDADVVYALGEQLDLFANRAIKKQLATVIGIDVTANPATTLKMLDAWAADNVELITSIDARYFDELRGLARDTVREGRSTASLTKAIEERYGVAQSRAELIARDQVGKLNSQITEARQTALGIEEYEWSTVGDERVRPAHVALDGTKRKWSDPHPTEGHPGSSIACRCSALPSL